MNWILFIPTFLLSVAIAEETAGQSFGTVLPKQIDTGENGGFLPAELAFQASSWLENDRLYIRFENASGYYLHRHQFDIKAAVSNVALGPLFIPPGTRIVHETLGEMNVFYNTVLLSAPVISKDEDANEIRILVSYQGCSDAGLCYTPQETYLKAASQSLLDTLPAANIR